jgi:hypothetical protein
MLDMMHNIKWSLAMPPKAAETGDTPFVSEIADKADFGSLTFLGLHGTNADANATYTLLVEHSDNSDLSGGEAVPDEYLLGVEAIGLDFADDNKAFKIGYNGPKRYVRVTITPSGNTGNAFIAGGWLQGHGRKVPLNDQVV